MREFSADGAAVTEHQTPHLTVRTSVSNPSVYAGSRLTLMATIALPEKMHVYAPGVDKPYIPIDWTIAESPAYTAFPVEYPQSRKLELKAIGETALVYEGKVALVRDIKIAQFRDAEKAAKNGKLTIEGGFKYQACDDRICYAPQTVPLRWELELTPYDRQRAPAELRGPGGVN
ncbi:MAG: protein-disulfide reductase DsbD family protein [Bryobacteraceae bacterium]